MMSNKPVRRRQNIDPRMIVGILAGLYGLSPIDGIPDFIPIAGQMDDIGVILLAVVAMLIMTMMQGGDSDE
jgi:uncharacterized membrane protein YkvA (DUF1232 family)